jgi:hypothetical protein
LGTYEMWFYLRITIDEGFISSCFKLEPLLVI